MLIEKEIESAVLAAVKAALDSAGVPLVAYSGVWQASNVGEVKGEESPSERVRVAAAVGSPAFDLYTSPVATVPVALAVVIRQELAPTAAEIEGVMSPIEGLLVDWQLDEGAEVVGASLSTDHFSADGVRMDPGSPAEFDSSRRAWRIVRSFSLRGVINNSK